MPRTPLPKRRPAATTLKRARESAISICASWNFGSQAVVLGVAFLFFVAIVEDQRCARVQRRRVELVRHFAESVFDERALQLRLGRREPRAQHVFGVRALSAIGFCNELACDLDRERAELAEAFWLAADVAPFVESFGKRNQGSA